MEYLSTMFHFFIGGLFSLLVITNPLSKIPLFIALTQPMPLTEKHTLAKQACAYAFAIMAVSLFAGSFILELFGISFGALRIAGGITVALLGYRMLFQSGDANFAHATKSKDVAFFPLAMPSISGPGSIAVIIGISTEVAELKNWTAKAAAYGGTLSSMALCCLLIWLVLRASPWLSKLLGNGLEPLTRLMGFLLICTGIQFVASGITTFVKAVALGKM